MATDNPNVVEITEANFMASVVEQSRQRPVLLDFWAPWCGPCKMLGPMLERLAEEFAGAFALAKVNVDEQQTLAGQFDVRSIPHVMLFKDGEIADEFSGAQPENQVRQFLSGYLGESKPAEDSRLAKAKAAADAGQFEEAIKSLRLILEDDPDHAEAKQLLAQIEFKREASQPAQTGTMEAEYRQGCELAAAGNHAEALAIFLKMIETDKTWNDAAARKAMLRVFDLVGARSPLAEEYRSKLAMALYR